MNQVKTYSTKKGLLLITLMFFFAIGFSQTSSSQKVIKHNSDKDAADVYVNNVFYQDGDLYLDLINNAKATTFYINGKLKNSETNKIENIKYLIVLDSNNINMLVIPAEAMSYIEFNLTNASTRSSDYVFYSNSTLSDNYMINSVETNNNKNNISIINNSPAQNSSASAITLNLNQATQLIADIYDMSGQKVANAANGFYPAGNLEINLSNKNLANGIYICKLNSDGQTQSFKFFNRNK